jgi:protein-S-isoprenylcysteine O-methyltransferase Ste14
MDKKLFFELTIVCAVTHIIRTVYEILKHRKVLEASKLTFVIMFINMLILWVSWVFLCRHDIFKVSLPLFLRYLGLVLWCLGIITFLMGLLTIKTLESHEGDLITKGIYAKIRHPMYFGFILWLIGFPTFFGALFSFFLSFLFIGNVLFWRKLEEKELEERFATYKDYRKSTIF